MVSQSHAPDRFEVRLSSVFAARCVRLALSWHMEYAAQLVEVRKHTTLFAVSSAMASRDHRRTLERDGQRSDRADGGRVAAQAAICPDTSTWRPW